MSQVISAPWMRLQAVAITGGQPKDQTTRYTGLALAVLGITGIFASVYFGLAENLAHF
jgi:hypothetical protein